MNKMILLTSLLFSLTVQAQQDNPRNHTLHLYIHNETHRGWEFTTILNSLPGNIFTIQPKRIAPGRIAIITARQSLKNDISASLLFKNDAGESAILFVLDQEQIHMGQPVFRFSSKSIASLVLSQTLNPEIGPRYLTFLKAELKVTDLPRQH